jgi:hypothetical protein
MVTLVFLKTSACSFMGYLLFTKLIGRGYVSLDETCLTNGYLYTTNGYLNTMLDQMQRHNRIIVDLDCINTVNVMKDSSHGIALRFRVYGLMIATLFLRLIIWLL